MAIPFHTEALIYVMVESHHDDAAGLLLRYTICPVAGITWVREAAAQTDIGRLYVYWALMHMDMPCKIKSSLKREVIEVLGAW